MTVFTTSDPIFKVLNESAGVNQAALQNFVNAINQNTYSNAMVTEAVLRGTVVFELVTAERLKENRAGAMYSNDRGSNEYISRGNKFAIQLDEDWFKTNGEKPAFFADPRNARAAMGIVTHEVEHNATQDMYDEAYRLRNSTPQSYQPNLVGAQRTAAIVDLVMRAEVRGWYADLNALRAELAAGRVSQGEFIARTSPAQLPPTVIGRLAELESEGQKRGLTGMALTNYIMDEGKLYLPSNYVPDYIRKFGLPNSDSAAVRDAMGYALNDPNGLKSFSEEVGPDGTYISRADYNNGQRVTTTFDGYKGGHIELHEVLQANGSYKKTETTEVKSYNPDGSYGDQIDRVYDFDGRVVRSRETDGARDNADYAVRETVFLAGVTEIITVSDADVATFTSTTSGGISTTYTQNANGNWVPVSWSQEGRSFSGGDLGAFITNTDSAFQAGKASAEQGAMQGRLNQLTANASQERAGAMNLAKGTADSLDFLARRLGMPGTSDRWIPALLGGEVPTALLLSSGMAGAVSQALGFHAESRINTLRQQSSIFSVTVNGIGSGFSLPLVLDLDDRGLDLVSMDKSKALFDVNVTGIAQAVGWVGRKNGILVLDKNGNGAVDNASEWFGQKFAISGAAAANQDGFKALALLSKPGSTSLSAQTSLVNAATGKLYFDELQVWIDADQDGRTDAGELRTLASLGIQSIDLVSKAVNSQVNGNLVVANAGYTTADGKRHEISDVGFSTSQPIYGGKVVPVSAAALAFTEYVASGYAAMSAGQARAIIATVQSLPTYDHIVAALQQKYGLPSGAGPLSPEALEAKAKQSWAVQAGLGANGLNGTITYFYGPDGNRASIPTEWRRINYAPWSLSNYFANNYGVEAARYGVLRTAEKIDNAAAMSIDSQSKAQVANAVQTDAARKAAVYAAATMTFAWDEAISKYLETRSDVAAAAQWLDSIRTDLNELVPVNSSLTGHLSSGGTFLTRTDATLAAEAFRAYAAAVEATSAVKVAGDQLLSSIAQSRGYTKAYVGENGKTTVLENGNNLFIDNGGTQNVILSSGVDQISFVGAYALGNTTVTGFQTGANGDRLAFMTGGGVAISRDGDGNAVLTSNNRKITLLGVSPTSLDIFANVIGAPSMSFIGVGTGTTWSLEGNEVYDGQRHVTTLYAPEEGATLIGSDRGSVLRGRGGDDRFVVTGRDYEIDGWSGRNTVSYAQLSAGVNLSHVVTYQETRVGDDFVSYQVITGTDNFGSKIQNVQNFIGSNYNDDISGRPDDNIIEGGKGNDVLTGGTGNDTYRFERGDGRDTIIEDDATAGNTDIAAFGADISADQLWFRRVGDHLAINVIGGDDQVTIKDWYRGNQYHVEKFKTGDGKILLDTQVQNLVQAMASFAPPTPGQTTLPPNYQSSLAPVIAANWH
ncbi:calcium-binding protein [Variovorax sp.]|uniref:calcium-binding protein n=1 Tax=Variovorax sp. TaxID=1871043 RepID=UPI003BAC15D2